MSALSFYHTQPSAWIQIKGEDAPDFLQSQFSNDLKKPYAQPVTYGLWLDRKGKVNADSFILQTGKEGFWIFSYYSPSEGILAKLEQNIVADEVELEDQRNSVVLISWWGKEARAFFGFAGWEIPAPAVYAQAEDGFLLCGRRSAQNNYDFIVARDRLGLFEEKVKAFGREHAVVWVSGKALQTERLIARIPMVPVDIGPTDLPQEGGLEEDALSFTKGCYLGQEVMARLYSMGQVQRRLYLVKMEMKSADASPPLPCDLYDGDRRAGQLRSAVYHHGSLIGHALLKNRMVEKNHAFALTPNGPACISIQEH